MYTWVMSLAIMGGLGYYFWREKFKTANPVSVNASPEVSAQEALPIMKEALEKTLGTYTANELAYCMAIAAIETNYGKGWNETRCPGGKAANNWGAVIGKDGFPCEDSNSDGSKYKTNFKVYDSPVDGAAGVVKQVLVNRPKVREALKGGDASVFRASLAMRRTSYYAGFCPKATKAYSTEDAKASFGKPDLNDGTRACEKEAVELHANAVAKKLAGIYPAMGGVNLVLSLGTYDEALSWFKQAA